MADPFNCHGECGLWGPLGARSHYSHSPAWHFRNAVARLSATVKIGGSARRPKRQWDKLDGKREWGYSFG